MSALEQGITRVLDSGCPDALAPVIRDFVTAVCAQLSDQDVGVLLVGSASRGELSWQMDGDTLRLFSDIEFLIGVEHHDLESQAHVDRHAQSICDAADLGSFFHIDYTFIEWSRLPKLDTKFFIFESKTCGVDLCRFELAPELPATHRDNLNFKELNEILVHRLSSIVHAIPHDFFDQNMDSSANQQLALALAKNTLDITTWLHPYEATQLIAGYGKRVHDWQQSGLQGLKLASFFVAEDLSYLQSCLALRQAPATVVDARQMLQQTLDLYRRSVDYVKHMNGIAEQRSVSAMAPSAQLFDEYRLRPRLSAAVSVLRHSRSVGVLRLARNMFGVRRGLAVDICSDLISAALRWTTDERDALGLLARARQNISKIITPPTAGDTDFASQWLAVRATFAQHQRITHNF